MERIYVSSGVGGEGQEGARQGAALPSRIHRGGVDAAGHAGCGDGEVPSAAPARAGGYPRPATRTWQCEGTRRLLRILLPLLSRLRLVCFCVELG